MLLDTHVFLWWRLDAPELKGASRDAILDPSNQVLVSVAVAWEIVIKRALGKLEFDGTVAAACAEEGFGSLPATVTHIDEIARLPSIHTDPFDRLLIAQARADRLTLVTHDTQVQAYDGFDLLPV